MTEREDLEKAMAALDQQRTVLGDAAVEAALAGLQQKLSALEKGEAAPPALAGERRVVTVLFCDIQGSTAMAEKLDPEEWAGIMKRSMTFLIPPVTRHDGIVARLMGDALLAFFGAPTTHEDDPQRAVRAGLEIVEGIAVLREQLLRERGLDFNVRVGIHTGLVFVGAIGADRRVEYTAVGDTMNLASRMEQAARPGSVQITEQTFKLVEPWFECEHLGEIQIKGKSEPVPAYRVLRVKAKPERGRGLEGYGLTSPLVGREQDLKTLVSCIERLYTQKEGRIVGILGEAGLGKSRLLAEAKFFAVANSSNFQWLEGHSLSFGQIISYWPFQQILRSWARITEDDDPDASWSKLESRTRELFGEETIEYLPYLASLLALEVRDEYADRVKYLDGEAMGKQIFLTSRRFIDRLAQSQPTVLVFEDIHWMDVSSTALLEHLLPLVETAPLVIIGLSRPERDTAAAQLRELCTTHFTDHYTEIRLAPLSDADSSRLIHSLLQIEDVPARLRELIVEKADGNPFFLEEVFRNLIDTGTVVYDASSKHWRVTAQIETIHIPDTIQGVIMARVDRLDQEVKQVLRVASVIGRSFLYRVLKAMSEASQRLDTSLDELQQTELIHKKQALPELEYIFKHALAQEATYESILLQKRRELHTRVAQSIETLFAERLEEFYGLLAYHYSKAEAWDKAQEYLLKAGDQAGRIAADAEALSLYQQALAAYARAFGDKWDPLQRAALERKMGEAFMRRGEYPLAMERFGHGLEYLGCRLPVSRWQIRGALLREMLVQAGHRLRRVSFRPGVEPVRAGTEDEVFMYANMGFIAAFTNPEQFLMLAYRIINVSERRVYGTGIVIGACQLGIALDFLPLSRLAASYHRSGLATSEAMGQPFSRGIACIGLQVHDYYGGELTQSLAHGRRAIEIFRQAGDLQEWGFSTSFYVHSCIHLCYFDEALSSVQELIHVGQDAGMRGLCCWGEAALGLLRMRQGHFQEAMVSQKKALELARAIPDYLYQTIAGSQLALCYFRLGDWQAALSELETSRRVAEEHKAIEPHTRVILLNSLATAYLYAFEHSQSSERAVWWKKAKRACQTAVKNSSVCKPRVPEALRLQGTYEWLSDRHAAAQKWWQKSLAEAERMGLGYDVGMTHMEMGMRLGEREHLDKAEAIFAEIGAELDLAKVREVFRRESAV
ncbi:MAG TPA: adenylate/guanylate cyclase domain-containing protein [Anaerolineales bacterium]|nr:adenylate/guanylate cyclase domain-containing protein [Anaerolineales bacterium]